MSKQPPQKNCGAHEANLISHKHFQYKAKNAADAPEEIPRDCILL